MKTLLKITVFLFVLHNFQSCSKDDAPAPPIVQQEPEPEPEPENRAPTQVSLLAPIANAENIDVKPTFSWEAATDPDGDQITYEIYADTTAAPSTLIGTSSDNSFEPEERLALIENYNWKVIAKDGKGGESESTEQGFNTRNIITSNATTSPGFDPRILHTSTVFNNKVWVIGGLSLNNPSALNDVWNSEDGVNWNLVTASANFEPRSGHKAVAFDNKLWIIGGFVTGAGTTKEVWNTEDGITWNLVNAQAGYSSSGLDDVIVFDNKMWVLNGDVWFSEDGEIWSLATDDFQNDVDAVVFQNKIWAFNDDETNINFSVDGFNWETKETNISTIISRLDQMNYNLISFDDKLWIINGADRNIAYSNDGSTWFTATSNPAFPVLFFFSSIVKDDSIWIIAGTSTGTNNFQDDIWFID